MLGGKRQSAHHTTPGQAKEGGPLRHAPEGVNCRQIKAGESKVGGDQGGMGQQVRLEDREHGSDPGNPCAEHPIPGLKQEQDEEQAHNGFGQTRPEQEGVSVVPVDKRPALHNGGGFGIVAPNPGDF